MQKTTKKLAAILLILVFSFSAVSFSSITQISSAQSDNDQWQDYDNYIVIDQDTTWNGRIVYDDPEKPVVLVNGATLTIKKGTTVKLLELDVFDGKIIAEGTESEKIIFTKAVPDFSNFPPDFNSECSPYQHHGIIEFNTWVENETEFPSFFRYVEFVNMGTYKAIDDSQCGLTMRNKPKKLHLFNTALADTELYYNPALRFRSGRLKIENSEFKNNSYADIEVDMDNYEGWPMSYLQAVNSNFSGNQQDTALISNSVVHPEDGGDSYHNGAKVILKNNWYGDSNGPKQATDYPAGGEIIKGNYTLDGYRKNDLIADPIILIPGIGASLNPDLMIGGIFKDNWTLFSHTYDGIIDALREMGFEEGKNFFICYYDWRNENENSAEDYLKPLIEKAKLSFGTSKVNLVAHSMGGLVARSYIQGGDDDYDYDVENLFLIGVPNKGASDVYPVWEGGYIPKNWETRNVIIPYLNYLNVKKFTFSNYESIHKFISSVKQLMPIYDYIHPEGEPQNLKDYSEMYETNDWLESLNESVDLLNERTMVNVISGDNQNTVNGIPVIDVDENPLWIDGKPEPLNPARNDSDGDGRVLLLSSQIEGLFSSTLDYNHGEIVSQSENIIANRLGGGLDIIHPAPDIPNELGFWFASPVDVEIKDSQGRTISGEVNEIPLAKYASESKPDGFKIVSIPNPINGEYEIKITGNGEGEFHIGSEYFDYENGENDHSSVAEGIISENEEKKYVVEYDPADPQNPVTSIAPQGGDETPPVIEIFSPQDQAKYSNDSSIDVNYKISDNVSSMENIQSEIYYDNQPFDEDRIDIYLEHLEKHAVKIAAEDEAGNKAEKEISFSAFATVGSITNNIGAYQKLNLIDRGEAKFILVHLKAIEHLFKQIEKGKGKIIEIRERQVNRYIDWLIYYVKNKSDKKPLGIIKEPAKSLLVESLEFIKFK